MRRIARTDATQAEIVSALRAAGYSVAILAPLGGGIADLLAGGHGMNYLLEVKSPGGKLTADELDWHLTWRGQVAVVRTPEEALYCVGALVPSAGREGA